MESEVGERSESGQEGRGRDKHVAWFGKAQVSQVIEDFGCVT